MINLLPPKEERKLRMERKQKIALVFCFLFLLFLLVSVLSLLFLDIYLVQRKSHYEEMRERKESNFEQQEIKEIEKKVREANEDLKDIAQHYEEAFDYSDLLKKVDFSLPGNIYVNNLTALYSEPEEEENFVKISLSGFAETREDLFSLKKNIEKVFGEVSFPPSNWIKATDINFSVNFSYYGD